MDRRELLRWLPAGAALECAPFVAPGLPIASGAEPEKPVDAARPAAAEDHRRPDDPHRTEPDPPGRRQGLDQRAGPLRPRLRHVHAAGLRGPDGRRQVPQAVPDRPRRRRDRGHLAVVLRQLLLAERPGPVQRHERRRHGALGHQGQAGRHAGLPAPGRQVPVRRRPLRPRPAGATSRRSRTASARRWRRATATSASRSPSPAWRPTAPRRRPTSRRSRSSSGPDRTRS